MPPNLGLQDDRVHKRARDAAAHPVSRLKIREMLFRFDVLEYPVNHVGYLLRGIADLPQGEVGGADPVLRIGSDRAEGFAEGRWMSRGYQQCRQNIIRVSRERYLH